MITIGPSPTAAILAPQDLFHSLCNTNVRLSGNFLPKNNQIFPCFLKKKL